MAGPADYGFASHEEVSLVATDGVALHAWWLPVQGAERTVLFLHGNAGNVSYWAEAAIVYRDLGWNTLLLDYRGYGRSQGEPSEEGTYLDAQAAWRHLINVRGLAPSQILVIGRSLGGGVATWLASEHEVGGLVLEATFTSIADVVEKLIPIPGIRHVVNLGYPSIERMAALRTPLLVVHGRSDELVPFQHGQTLFAAATGPKRFIELQGGHNDAFTIDRRTYEQSLRSFAAEFMPQASR